MVESATIAPKASHVNDLTPTHHVSYDAGRSDRPEQPFMPILAVLFDFDGVLADLTRRYRETSSAAMRERIESDVQSIPMSRDISVANHCTGCITPPAVDPERDAAGASPRSTTQ